MPMTFTGLVPKSTWTREALAKLWKRSVPKGDFFVEHDGRVALFATQFNTRDGWGQDDEPWFNELDEKAGIFKAQVNPRREEKNQRIREVGANGELALFYRLQSPQPFEYKGLVTYIDDQRAGERLSLILRLP